MAEPQDSNVAEAAVSPGATTPAGHDASPAGDSRSDVVPRSDLEAERKRRGGQERAHQREMRTLRDDLASIKNQLAEVVQGRPPADGFTTIPQDVLNALDPTDPKDQIILNTYRNQSQWAKHQRDEAEATLRDQKLREAVEEAVEDEVEAGVPRAMLDLASPTAVHTSAERWRQSEELRQLRDEVRSLRGSHQTAEQAAQQATLRARQELGATMVQTSIGEQPPLPSAVQQEVDRLEQEIELAKRQRKGSEIMRLRREQQVLIQEAAP